jgi:hypothetical protein
MSPKITPELNALSKASEEPITDFEMVMEKIQHDSHIEFNGVENVALQNKNIKKEYQKDGDETQK